jgi:hypothetical protein
MYDRGLSRKYQGSTAYEDHRASKIGKPRFIRAHPLCSPPPRALLRPAAAHSAPFPSRCHTAGAATLSLLHRPKVARELLERAQLLLGETRPDHLQRIVKVPQLDGPDPVRRHARDRGPQLPHRPECRLAAERCQVARAVAVCRAHDF